MVSWRKKSLAVPAEGFVGGAVRLNSSRSSRQLRRDSSSIPRSASNPTPEGRLAVLEGLLWAIDHRIELVELAHHSADSKELERRLVEDYGLRPGQCELIRSMPMQRMTKDRRRELQEEADGIRDVVRQVHDKTVDYLENHWSSMTDEKPQVLRSWTDGSRVLLVYKPYPDSAPQYVYGIDNCVDVPRPSPVGDVAGIDDRAAQIARYQVLEPRGTLAPRHPDAETIYWIPADSDDKSRPLTVRELKQP